MIQDLEVCIQWMRDVSLKTVLKSTDGEILQAAVTMLIGLQSSEKSLPDPYWTRQ